MCNIAGYVGEKRAAPILIEMLRRQEKLDGYLSTGITTIDKGVLYHTKVIGNLDTLLKQTDAIDFPGNIGLIHTRPGSSFLEHAHPIVSSDEKMAIVLNGNMCPDNKDVKDKNIDFLYENGVEITTAKVMKQSRYPCLKDGRFVSEGEAVIKSAEYMIKNHNYSYPQALKDAMEKFYGDIVTVMISADTPDKIYVSRISRPMNIAVSDDGSYISTSQFGFLPDVKYSIMESLPQTSVSVVTKEGHTDTGCMINGGKVTDYSCEEKAQMLSKLKKALKENAYSMDTIGGVIFDEAKLVTYDLRPKAKTIYDLLWEIEKEGILKREERVSTLPWEPQSTVKRYFFYI